MSLYTLFVIKNEMLSPEYFGYLLAFLFALACLYCLRECSSCTRLAQDRSLWPKCDRQLYWKPRTQSRDANSPCRDENGGREKQAVADERNEDKQTLKRLQQANASIGHAEAKDWVQLYFGGPYTRQDSADKLANPKLNGLVQEVCGKLFLSQIKSVEEFQKRMELLEQNPFYHLKESVDHRFSFSTISIKKLRKALARLGTYLKDCTLKLMEDELKQAIQNREPCVRFSYVIQTVHSPKLGFAFYLAKIDYEEKVVRICQVSSHWRFFVVRENPDTHRLELEAPPTPSTPSSESESSDDEEEDLSVPSLRLRTPSSSSSSSNNEL